MIGLTGVVRAMAAGATALAAIGVCGAAQARAAAPLEAESFAGAGVSADKWVVGSPKGADHPCATAATTTQPGFVNACREVLAGKKAADPVGSGVFRLTDASTQNAGNLLLNRAIDARKGLSLEFDMYMYDASKVVTDSYGSNGADGISFYLVDGSQAKVDAGEPGGSLGYQGTSGAIVGVGFDQFGNFSKSVAGKGGQAARKPNSVVLRGGQSTGYVYVAGTSLDAKAQRLGVESTKQRTAARRHVVVDIAPTGLMQVGIDFQDGKGLQPIISQDLHTLPGQQALPETVKLGWAASTGDATSVHEISGFTARSLDADLTVATTNDGPWKAGGTGSYDVRVAVAKEYGWSDDPVKVVHTVPAGVKPTAAKGDGWSCAIAGQDVTCTSTQVVRPGGSYPPVKIDVAVAQGTSGSVEARTEVSIPTALKGGVEIDQNNNTATSTAQVADGKRSCDAAFMSRDLPTQLTTVDRTAGSLTPVPNSFSGSDGYNAIGFNRSDGRIYGWNNTAKKIIILDPATGASELKAVLPNAAGANLASQNYWAGDVDPQGRYLYLSGGGKDAIHVVDVDPASPGYLRFVRTTPLTGATWSAVYDLAFNPADGRLYTVGEFAGWLWRIDPVTGVAENLGGRFPAAQYGGIFFDKAGVLYASDNKGPVWRLDLSASTPAAPLTSDRIGTSVRAGTLPVTTINDGAGCMPS